MQDVIAAKRRELNGSSIATYAMQFSHILPAGFLHGFSVSKRMRQYCNVVWSPAVSELFLPASR
jgi:hypothetical protein